MTKGIENLLSKTQKLILIEIIVIFFYIVLAINFEYGVIYLFFSPALPLVFALAFVIIGYKFEKESNFWKGMSALNLALFFLLSSMFWFGNMFRNYR